MLNKMLVIGNVGRDPEMRYTPNGSAVTSFSLAVNRRIILRPTANRQEETEWFDVVCLGSSRGDLQQLCYEEA